MDTNLHEQDTQGKEYVYTREIAIDSCKLRIPLERVTLLSNRLQAQAQGQKVLGVLEDTGEVIGEIEYKGIDKLHKERGISTRMTIATFRIGNSEIQSKFLVIGLNAKMLKGKYFKGITQDTAMDAYQYLMELGLVRFSWEDFLAGAVTDADYKVDTRQPKDMVIDWVRQLREKTPLNNKRGKGSEAFTQPTNTGIHWGDRHKKNFLTQQHLKLYDKQIELQNNSNEFMRTYLDPSEVRGRVRIETNVKNAKHFKYFGIEDTSLGALLMLEQDKMCQFFGRAFQVHLGDRVHTDKKLQDIKPMDRALAYTIQLGMKHGYSFDMLQDNILNTLDTRKQKHDMRQTLQRIYTIILKGTTEDETTRELDSILTGLGWN